MGWSNGCYYRSRRQGRRVAREYVGKGTVAQLCAQLDAVERERRLLAAAARQHQRGELQALDDQVAALGEAADLLARAALLAAGYRQHKRGEWRRRRAQREQSC
jgi:hypothetical protein